MASKNPRLRLRHILDEAAEIRAALQGLSFETFRDTWLIRRAVEHGLLIITEAAKSLPAEMKAAHPAIAWGKLESFGNFLRHEYRRVDPDTLWRIATVDLPSLEPTVRQMLAELDS